MIKFLVMDVDGTLTDGRIYMGVDGEAVKAFDIKDGYALHTLLKEYGIIPVIITARKSPMVEHRCKELGVTEIHQGVMNKLDCLKGILEKYSSADQQYDLSNVAYIGDDLLDLQCMRPITEAGGIAGCPSNAVKGVIAACSYVALNKGGEGAVRDFTEYIIAYNKEADYRLKDLEERCLNAAEYLSRLKGDELSIGRHDINESFYYSVQGYLTDGDNNKLYESHRKFVDIQMLLKGEEIMQFTDIKGLEEEIPYDENKDVTLYKPSNNASGVILRPGSVLFLYPKDGHRSISYLGKNCEVIKIVGKIKL